MIKCPGLQALVLNHPIMNAALVVALETELAYRGPERRGAENAGLVRLMASVLDEVDYGLMLLSADGLVVHANHAALRECFTALQKAGVRGIHYLAGDNLLGEDAEASTDGSHPSDLGFVRQADQFERILRKVLPRSR